MLDESLYNELIDAVQAQYKGTNINALLNGILEIKKKYIYNAYKSLIQDNFNLLTAKDDGLDLWARILNFTRYVNIKSEKVYNKFNFYECNFYNLNFYSDEVLEYTRLDDEQLRKILVILYQGQFIYPSIENVNTFANKLLNEYGEVRVKDSQDMSFITYIINNELPDWLTWIFENYDILPRPAGVGIKITSTTGGLTFKFAPSEPVKDNDYQFFNFSSNFNKLSFYNPLISYNDYERAGTDWQLVTEETYKTNMEEAKNEITNFYKGNFYHFKAVEEPNKFNFFNTNFYNLNFKKQEN